MIVFHGVIFFSIFGVWYCVAMKIGIMGAQGSFSEKAGEEYLSQQYIENGELVPLINAETVLSELEAGNIDKGLFPIENSNAGVVIESVHAMAKHRFVVERMFEINVHHMLLVQPGTKASSVTAVTSHDQAIKQCRMYLRRVWPDAEIQQYVDTAKAAEDLSEGKLSDTTAVIAPRRCAELYGLEILEESIQDLKFNYTSFVVAVQLKK